MKYNVTQKLIESHLVSGKLKPGTEISIRIDQTLTQDATGTMVMLELEAMQLRRVLSVRCKAVLRQQLRLKWLTASWTS